MKNILLILFIYSITYIVFTIIGYGVSRYLFRQRLYWVNTLSPMLGFSIFGVISTALMYYLPGRQAGHWGLLATAFLSMIGYYFSPAVPGYTRKQAIRSFIKTHRIAFGAGLILLLPLLIAHDVGIFALNGADFGSYAGWGKYFQEYTLKEFLPHHEPINFSLKSFVNLQNNLTSPHGALRVGNVTFFTAYNAFFPQMWPTIYSVLIGFIVAQFTVSFQFFARVVLLQKMSIVFWLGLVSYLLNTVYWLASSHYVPNVAGFTYTLILTALYMRLTSWNLYYLIGISLIQAAMLLMYPESYFFLIGLLSTQLLARFNLSLKKPWYRHRLLLVGAGFIICSALSLLWAFQASGHCLRHLLYNILSYDRPGDYVWIFKWAYPSQLLGFADYNAMLLKEHAGQLRLLTIFGYLACATIIGFGLTRKAYSIRNQLRLNTIRMLVLMITVFLIPIILYLCRYQLLLAWRAMLTLSPYLWLLISIFGIQAFASLKLQHKTDPNRFLKLTIVSFIWLLIIALGFRIGMIKNMVRGSTHATIFGEAFMQTASFLNKNKNQFDIALVDYEGSGTIQGGWEFYMQEFPYLFPQHGAGNNEYLTEPLKNKRLILISDTSYKVHKLTGFEQNTSKFNGLTIAYTKDNNLLQPYSSSWLYYGSGPTAQLSLPGLPGKLLLWLKEDANACLRMDVSSARAAAYMRVTFNQSKMVQDKVENLSQQKICSDFHRGLNEIRLEPIFQDKNIQHAQHLLIQGLIERARLHKKLTEQEQGLLLIYTNLHPTDPLFAPGVGNWGVDWNLIIPPDTIPLNPHVFFKSIEIEKL